MAKTSYEYQQRIAELGLRLSRDAFDGHERIREILNAIEYNLAKM